MTILDKFVTQPEPNANLILTGLWLGNYKAATDLDFLMDNKIDHIINITTDLPNLFNFISCTQYRIRDSDACDKNLTAMMDQAVDIIHQKLLCKKNVLVHCKNGHHRSASVIVYYLIKYYNMHLSDAIIFVKHIRPTTLQRSTCLLKHLIQHQSLL